RTRRLAGHSRGLSLIRLEGERGRVADEKGAQATRVAVEIRDVGLAGLCAAIRAGVERNDEALEDGGVAAIEQRGGPENRTRDATRPRSVDLDDLSVDRRGVEAPGEGVGPLPLPERIAT